VFGIRADEGKEFEVLGKQLTCPICAHTRLTTRRSLPNTRVLTFLELDWANRRATNFVCENCGHVLWFVPQR
jgi:transcription elongation factor Elf1